MGLKGEWPDFSAGEHPCPSATSRAATPQRSRWGRRLRHLSSSIPTSKGNLKLPFSLMTHAPAVTAGKSFKNQYRMCSVQAAASGPAYNQTEVLRLIAVTTSGVSAGYVHSSKGKSNDYFYSMRFLEEANRSRAGSVSSSNASLLILAPVPMREEQTPSLASVSQGNMSFLSPWHIQSNTAPPSEKN